MALRTLTVGHKRSRFSRGYSAGWNLSRKEPRRLWAWTKPEADPRITREMRENVAIPKYPRRPARMRAGVEARNQGRILDWNLPRRKERTEVGLQEK